MSLKMPVRVSIDHCVDASDTDADGMHDWHYEYDVYRFSRGWRSFVARAYTDEPGKIAFLSCEVKVFGFYRHRLLSSADLKSSLFGAAVAHLRGLGMTSFDRLTNIGYVSIEDPDLAGETEWSRVLRRSKLLRTTRLWKLEKGLCAKHSVADIPVASSAPASLPPDLAVFRRSGFS